MSGWTKEPWFIGGPVQDDGTFLAISAASRDPVLVDIAEVRIGFVGKIEDEQQANAFRIIAAVNACAGIPTGNLEAGGVLETIIKERDELLAALNKIADECYTPLPSRETLADIYKIAAVAIAKAEDGQK